MPYRHSLGPVEINRSVAASVGDALCRRRNMAGLTQEELATRASVSLRFIKRVESGNPNQTDKLVTLLRCLAACQTDGGA